MDTLIREINGKEEIWYSDSYLKKQIELAFRAGIQKGIRVEFCALQTFNKKMVNDLTTEFNKRVSDEYKKAFENSEVWRIS
jgi:predicted transcriptional regulator